MKLIILLAFVLIGSFECFSQDTLNEKYKKEFCEFAAKYKPLYILDGDTLTVPTYNLPSNGLNNYLLQCSGSKDYRLLNYAIIILRKQQKEYIKISNQDYILDNPDYSNIGYLELIRTFLGIEKNESYIEPVFSGELLSMLYQRRKDILNYPN